MKRIIFYLPFKIDRNRFSASQIRPVKMLDTFKEIGYEVDLVEGYAKDRSIAIKKIKDKIKQGVKYDFLYSESSTLPFLLTECHHYPIHPFLDFGFFLFCRKHGIKIGLFYRDIFWRFNIHKTSIWKKKLLIWFHKYDLRKYQELVDVLFVPSLEMLAYLPFNLKICTQSLPAGCVVHEKGIPQVHVKKEKIEFLYVGGIGSHYDLKLFLKVLNVTKGGHFTFCCRREEWNMVSKEYEEYLSDNVSIVHESGPNLDLLYRKADVFCLFVNPSEYWKFAVPYKLFETIGWKCPILASKGTWIADYIEENQIGITCKYDENELKYLLEDLSVESLSMYRRQLENLAVSQSWESRCSLVASLLSNAI